MNSAKKYDNVYVETSGIPYAGHEEDIDFETPPRSGGEDDVAKYSALDSKMNRNRKLSKTETINIGRL